MIINEQFQSAWNNIPDLAVMALNAATDLAECVERQFQRLVKTLTTPIAPLCRHALLHESLSLTSPFTKEAREEVQNLISRIRSMTSSPTVADASGICQEALDAIQRHTEECLENAQPVDPSEILWWHRMMVMEVVAKEWSSLSGHAPGLTPSLFIPQENEGGKLTRVRYELTQSINLLKSRSDEQPVFILEPEVASFLPIVVFTSTRINRLSVMANLDLRGAAYTLFENNLKTLRQCFEKLKKVQVIGYSQGGLMAQRAYLDPYMTEQISKDPRYPTVSFSAPGGSKRLLAQFEDIRKDDPTLTDNLILFVTHGDFASKVGELIPGNVFHIKTILKESTWVHHCGAKLPLVDKLSKVDVERENKDPIRLRGNGFRDHLRELIYGASEAPRPMLPVSRLV